ncbi:MFS transporter [Silvibacterium sp.]|uniref:MFS transporter n=1 Tax=Silvibacterium sp. TaxID=1964179 RepID=UPI0039E50AFD
MPAELNTTYDASIGPTPVQSRLLLLGLAFATGMEFYTFESMNLVLPDITGTLGVSFDEASWLLTVYSCALFLGVPISIWLAGHLGYKRFLIGTTALFAFATVGAALSPTLDSMLIWRALSGLAGAGLTVWWRASIYVLMPKQRRSPSLMRVSVGLYLASAMGLLLSGFLTDRLNWRLICIPNIFLATGAIWLLRRNFPELPKSESSRLRHTDRWGLILLATGVICLQIVLSRGHIDDWFSSPRIRILSLVSAAAFLAFLHWQTSSDNHYPLFNLALLKNRNVVAAMLIGIFLGMILSGSLFVLPEFLRNVDAQTHSATQTGRILAFYALAAATVRPSITWLIARFGPRKLMAVALTMMIGAMLLLYRWLTTSTSDGYFFLPLAMYAGCLAALLPSVGSGTVAKLDQANLLDGVSLYMTFRQLGAALGVALLTILIERRQTLHSSRLYEHLNAGNISTSGALQHTGAYLVSQAGVSPSGAYMTSVDLLSHSSRHQVEVLSYADCFLFMALAGVIAMCLIPVMSPFIAPSNLSNRAKR